ncbi:putative reverse transcriptase domain-containing protein [Tanacetum coccineum]|uniref:Reverse transcriptase domain-containing protein n=1 Tax=Tanacetum coccineum TaxID=301880 RepID=A0ABQ5I1S3_9ASTR
MARKSMSQTERQEDKVAENASNKRKWEGNHNGSSSQQNKGHRVPRADTTRPISKKAYVGSLPLCNQCKFHHNGPTLVSAEIEPTIAEQEENISRAYTAGHGEKKHYDGSKPLCSKCNYHHDGPCAPKCHECNKVGHLARDCWSSINANTTNNQKGIGASQKANCYECGNQGHYRKDCPEQKNQNHENQIRGAGARGVVCALRGGETDQDPNNIEDEIEA